MCRGQRRVAFVNFCTAALLWGLTAVPALSESRTFHFELSNQSLSQALRSFGQIAGQEIIFTEEVVAGRGLTSLKGDFTAEEALSRLLQGTGLTAKRSPSGALMIVSRESTGAADSPRSDQSIQNASSGSSDDASTSEEAGKKSSQDFRVAQVGQGKSSSASSPVNQTSNSQGNSVNPSTALSEIIVTAQKRTERLQDVPVPVTAISADTLIDSNQLRIQDYYTRVPGLSVTPNVTSTTSLTIRGISTGGFNNPTVGVTVDDVPYGSSTSIGGGEVIPDLDPGDLARIEVLRGPQGTLYGASSMGGLLKFVTVDPSTDSVSGRAQIGTSSVQNGAELGYNVRGSVNVPLSDTVAVRASGFTREDPGYIDNPVLNVDGINKSRTSGGRLSALWRPSDLFSLKLSALYQDSKADGSNDVDLESGLGDLQQNYLRGVGGVDKETQAYSATLSATLGSVNLTGVSGYNINSYNDSFDYSSVLGAPSLITDDNRTKKFTQEIRVSAPLGQRLEGTFGVFYTHEDTMFVQQLLNEDPVSGARVGSLLYGSIPTIFTESAVFTDFTYHFTDRFDVQIGARESQIRQELAEVEIGPFAPQPSPFTIPTIHSKGNAFTYLATPRYKLSSNLMVYARLASGYRAGGINVDAGPGTPPVYNPDKTQNYEIGIKGEFLDHSLSIDASFYYIDWKDIQIFLLSPTGFGYNTNGSQAKSQGTELSVESKPLPGLTIAGWISLNDAKLTESFLPGAPGSAYGVSGDRLANSSRFSGFVSVNQDFPLWRTLAGFVEGMASYTGDRVGVFGTQQAPARQTYPAYTKIDLRTGAKFDSWTVNVFVDNVANKRGVLMGGLGYVPTFGFLYIQPRTLGASVSKSF